LTKFVLLKERRFKLLIKVFTKNVQKNKSNYKNRRKEIIQIIMILGERENILKWRKINKEKCWLERLIQ
jgi:hypothetical protein